MVFYIGINPIDGKCLAAENATKEDAIISIDIEKISPDEIEKIDNLFEYIKLYFNEEISNACIFLNNKYCNEIRLQFLKSAKNHDIQNSCIIDLTTALFLHALHKSAYKPKNGDKIGIIWSKRCYIFYFTINVAFLDSYPFHSRENQSMVKKLEAPTAMFFDEKIGNEYNLLPTYYSYSDFTPEMGAFLKASYITNKINEYSWITSKCGRTFEVFIDDRNVLTILPTERLPYKKPIKIGKGGENFMLKIVENNTLTKQFVLTVNSFIFGINSMGIYYFKNMDYTELVVIVKEHNKNEIKEPRKTHLRQKIMSRKNPKIITERFSCPTFKTAGTNSNFVKEMQQLDQIQTKINIVEKFISAGYSNFEFEDIEDICTKITTYEVIVAGLESLLENVKINNRDKNDKRQASSIQIATDSAASKCANLKANLKNLKTFLQLAETYLVLYDKEMKWITENNIKFDNAANVRISIENIAILKTDFEKHKDGCDKVVSVGKEIIQKIDKNHVKLFIEEFNSKFGEFQVLIKSYNKITYILQEINECNKKAEAIKMWINDNNNNNIKHQNFTKNISRIIYENLKHFLLQIEKYSAVILEFEEKTNDLINEIEKSENQIKIKFLVSLYSLQNLRNDIHDAYFHLKKNLTTKLEKMKDEKMAEFDNSCNSIEEWIKDTINTVKCFEIRLGELEMRESFLLNISRTMKYKNEDVIEKLLLDNAIFDTNEAKIRIKNVENLRDEANNIIAEKLLQIQSMKDILHFFDECKTITALTTYKINSLKVIRYESQLSSLNDEYKQVHENILELIKRGKSLKNEDEKQTTMIESRIQELQTVYDTLFNLVETKIQEFDKQKKISTFFTSAKETVNYLENAIHDMEFNEKSNESTNILMEKHLKLRNELLENKSVVENVVKLGERLMENKTDSKTVNKMLEKISEAAEILDSMWQKQFEKYDELEYAETFNFVADQTMKSLEEYYALTKTNSVTPSEIDKKNAAVNLEIYRLEEMAERKKYFDQNLKVNVKFRIIEIKKMKDKALTITNKSLNNSRLGSSFKGLPPTFTRKPSRRLTNFSSCSSFQNLEYESYYIPTKVDFYRDEIDAIGMDLGTTRCCMAIKRNNKIDAIALDNTGETLLPSIVSFDDEAATCGKYVLERLPKTNAKCTCFDVKRIIGKSRLDVVQDDSWPFDVIENGKDVLIKLASIKEEIKKTPEEVSAVLLKHMKESASILEGKELTKAVLTVPAAFTERQERATLKAAKLAGWKEIELLPEPVAAAFAYFNNREIPNNSNVLLFDLGGGTLDVCLFRITDENLEIVSNVGDTCLGGRDIDNLLIDHFTKVLEFKYGIILKEKEKKRYKLMLECQRIKHSLTISEMEFFDVQNFDENIKETITIRREELEKMVLKMNIKSRILTLINQNLFNAQMTQKQIDKVLQVGGGCRMPMIKNLLKEIFPNADHCCVEQPDEIVAVGAAIYAYHLATINSKNN